MKHRAYWALALALGVACAMPARGEPPVPTVKLTLTLTLPPGEQPEKVTVQIPKLKFNKRVLMSYTLDDDPAGAYGRVFTLINRKWIDDLNYCHVGTPNTTGYLPEKTLGYTDGTGIEKRFTAGVAIWPSSGNKYLANFMQKDNPPADWRDPYLKWYEIPLLLDFGFSVYEHNTGTDDPNDQDKIVAGFAKCQAITRSKLNGRGFKVLMEPDGNYNYCEAAFRFPEIRMICNQGRGKSVQHFPLTDTVEFEKTVITRRFHTTPTVEEEFAYVQKNHDEANPRWYHFSTHAPSVFVQRLLRLINDTYGKDGRDDIWFATCDEYYEYDFMRKHASIAVSLSGKGIELSLVIPQGVDFYYNDLSLLVHGIKDPGKVIVSAGTNASALSWAPSSGSLLVNVGFNPSLVERAERYTTRFEASRLEGDREDALYFTAQLRRELQAPLRSRIDAVKVRAPLRIEEMSVGRITEGEKSREFPVTFRSSRVPAEYKVLDHREHSKDPWIAYHPGAPIVLKTALRTNETQDVSLILRDAEATSPMILTTVKIADHR